MIRSIFLVIRNLVSSSQHQALLHVFFISCLGLKFIDSHKVTVNILGPINLVEVWTVPLMKLVLSSKVVDFRLSMNLIHKTQCQVL